MLAIVDTGPLLAVSDQDDPYNKKCIDVLSRGDLQFVVPVLVVAETATFIGRRLGAVAESRFIARLNNFEIDSPVSTDWSRIAEIVSTYRDFPIGGVDASVVALAERLNTDLIVTLDQRHFRAITPRHVPAFRLLPE